MSAAAQIPAATPPPRTGSSQRGIELLLLVFAAVIVTVALVLTDATQNQTLSIQLLYRRSSLKERGRSSLKERAGQPPF